MRSRSTRCVLFGSTVVENRLRIKDGRHKWVAWSYFPVPEDGLAFGLGRDMTELRQIHEFLRLRAQELEDANRVKDDSSRLCHTSCERR